MKINPSHLISLATIRRETSLSKAAEALNSSQPALSRLVSDLELRLGAPLFDRSSRPWKTTALGEALALQGLNVETAQARAERALDEMRAGSRGVLKIGGPPFFIDTLVAPMIARFQQSNPGIQVDQSYGYPVELTRKVQSSDIDLAICPLDPLEDTVGLQFEQVLPARNVIAARKDHPLTKLRRIQPQDLKNYAWISPPQNSPLRMDLQSSLLAAGLQNVRIAYSGAGFTGIANHLRNSDCLTVLPHSVVFELRRQGEIVALPFVLTAPVRSLGLLTKAKSLRAKITDSFHDHLTREFNAIRDQIRRHEESVLWGNSRRRTQQK